MGKEKVPLGPCRPLLSPATLPGGARLSGSMCARADAVMARGRSSQVSLKQDDSQPSTRGLPLPCPHCRARTHSPFQASPDIREPLHRADLKLQAPACIQDFPTSVSWRAVGSPDHEPQNPLDVGTQYNLF